MRIKVLGSYQVVFDGERYVGGDEFDAPDGDAQPWVDAGYVEQVKSKAKAQDSAANKAQQSQSAANKSVDSASKK